MATRAAPAAQPAATTVTAPSRRARTGRLGTVLGAGGAPVETGAGFVLGLLVWGWVVLPFLKGGPSGGPKAVKDVLRAKFFNRGSDGSWLA